MIIWEKLNVPPMPKILPKQDVSHWQKIHWGIVPIILLLFTLIIYLQSFKIKSVASELKKKNIERGLYLNFSKNLLRVSYVWYLIMVILFLKK